MRWPVVAFFAYVLLGMELAVKPHLAIGPTRIAPSFIVPFIVFIAMSAPMLPTLWVALVLGAVFDLLSPRGDGAVPVLGPYALGYLIGAFLTLTLRGVMFRRSPLTMMFLAVLASLIAELVVVGFFTVRSVYTDSGAGWSAGAELLKRALSSLYTLATAGMLGIVLLPMASLFGFQDSHSRRSVRRGERRPSSTR
jgi:rod shape-determining protein MreD